MSNPPFACPLCGCTSFLVLRVAGEQDFTGAICEDCGQRVTPQQVRDWSELMRDSSSSPLGRINWRIVDPGSE